MVPTNLAGLVAIPQALPHFNLDEQGWALRGYDPVAYFDENRAIKGSQQFITEWEGALWSFISAENRDLFTNNPETYAPANGGYCTFGVVLAKKFDGDPNVWLLHNKRLYVFLNEEVKSQFLQDINDNLAKVESNWPQIKDKSSEALES
ncbi:MAG: hypothetical protein HC886_06410 [Leptolyngbyaceae cyanobacterium SM1_1_3]|nr:hypothetical protein [Leptolyngbyaceae cyanobacterium SM1_1_3]NJN03528.1 hypothetical protein [Leptolyngbyaceae cyanobacterium RM1_1_2]NJO10254.1 hypothetical protein [Leptolyngbyaceae cyanobacterium SL_1_1]